MSDEQEGPMVDGQPVRAACPPDVDALYRAHVRPLYAFIYGKVGNREAAEDLTSEVFTRALAHLDPARDAHSSVAWLYRVARNAVTDYWRANGSGRVIAFAEASMSHVPPPLPDATLHERAATRAGALLARLPDNYRTVLTLRVLDGMSVAETAQRMGVSTANVKVLQHRALKYAAALREDEAGDG